MVNTLYAEPFEGYNAALDSVQPQMAGGGDPGMLLTPPGSPPSGGNFQAMLLQALMAPSPMQETKSKEPAEPPKWMYLIPGFAVGAAKRRQMDAQQEELKLRRQQLAGQQAMQKLQQLQIAQKIEQQQALQQWGSLYGGLIRNEDVLDPEAKRDLEGQLVEGLARHGNPEQVQKFIEARQAQRNLDAMNAIDWGDGSGAAASMAPPAPPAAPGPTAAAPTGPPALYEQMARTYASSVGVDPNLAVAVMRQESASNPTVVGDGGKSVGLYQLHEAGAGAGMSTAQRADPQTNIRVGVDFLKKQLEATGGNVQQALLRYNGGGNPAYPAQVLARMPAESAAPSPAAVSQYAQDQQLYQQLRQREALLQAGLRQAGRYLTSDRLKAQYAAHKDDLEQVQKRIADLEKRLTPTGSDIEQVTGIPHAYLTPATLQQGGQLLQQRRVETQAAQGREAAAIAGEKAATIKEGELRGQREFQAQQSLSEVQKDDARNYINIRTGKQVPGGTKYAEVRQQEAAGEVVRLKDDEYKTYQGIQRMVPLLNQIRGNIEQVYGPGGIFESLTPQQRLVAAGKGGWARLTQTNPQLEVTAREIKGNVDLIRRNLQGQVGTQTEGDAKRGLTALPQLDGIPDSKEVAFRTYNELLQSINGSLQTILGNHQYSHPGLQPLAVGAGPGFKILGITPRPEGQ